MELAYAVYLALAIVGLLLNIVVTILRLYRHQTRRLSRVSEEHGCCLLTNNLLLTLASLVAALSALQTVFPENSGLCDVAGFTCVYLALLVSWAPLMTAIILYEKEKYSLRIKSYQGMTPRIVLFIVGAEAIISAALVAINYVPIAEFDRKRLLLCLPITFPSQLGAEYTMLVIALIWVGIVSTWGCSIAWLVFLLKNSRSVRYVTECPRSTKSAGFQMMACLAVWTVAMSVYSVYYWAPIENLLHTATLLSLLYFIGHPLISLITHWLGGVEEELNSSLSRDMPSRLTYIAPLTVNPDKNTMKFHGRWLGKFNEKVQAVIKVYNSEQRSKWLREVKAMSMLKKTEHPNIVRYLWVSRGNSLKYPQTHLTQDCLNLLADPSNRMVSMQYYEHRSLRELLLHKSAVVTDTTLKYISLDIASALVHLRQLHIAHNKLSSKTVFIKSTPKNNVLTAVVGGFEESEYVVLDHHRHYGKATVTPTSLLANHQLDNKFAADIRSYALLLLELVSAWNRRNGHPLKAVATRPLKASSQIPQRSSNSESVCLQKKRRQRTTTPTKLRTLSQRPAFGEIKEEAQSNLHMARVVNGEEVAIEFDDIEDPIMDQRGNDYRCETGVIIPPGLQDRSFLDYTRVHPAVMRKDSSSACSTDSGYPKSFASGALPHFALDSNGSDKSHATNQNRKESGHGNIAFIRVDEQPTSDQSSYQRIARNHQYTVHDTRKRKQKGPRLGPEALRNISEYMKAKNSLPSDILGDYEEYQIGEDSAFSEEEGDKTYEPVTLKAGEDSSPKHLQTSEVDLDLSELAEKVTNDIDTFFKSKSRSNSNVSSAVSSPRCGFGALDSLSQQSDLSDVTFSSTVEQPLHLRLDRELYIDKILFDKHRTNANTGRFIYRAGITKAQLYYSKELASMYEIITPQLLYLSKAKTKESLREYRKKLQGSTVSQLLALSEGCWLEDPVQSAESVLSQLRRGFTAPHTVSTA